ncbi:PKD domain-containing protein [Pontiellaceae bacterium B12227]|nr:PKD domain-containing protein [Pontiellaceae bacterium B12227]
MTKIMSGVQLAFIFAVPFICFGNHEPRPLPQMARPAPAKPDRVYYGALSAPRGFPKGVLQDILLYDGERPIPLNLRSPAGFVDGDPSLFDGDPATALDTKDKAVSFRLLMNPKATDVVIRTTDAKKLKGVTLLLKSPRWRTMYEADLGVLAAEPSAPAYRINLASGNVTPLKQSPTVELYHHPELRELIKGHAATVNALPTLAPGQGIAVEFERNAFEITPKENNETFGLKVGEYIFSIKGHTVLSTPDGKQHRIKRAMGKAPVKITLMLVRSSTGDTITWFVFGQRHDVYGETLLPEGTSTVLPLGLILKSLGKEPLTAVAAQVGKPVGGLARLPVADPYQEETLSETLYDWNLDRLRKNALEKQGKELPVLRLERQYGAMTEKELQDFKAYARNFPLPTSNNNNKIIFGAEQGARGIYFTLMLSQDDELRGILERWADSILEHRNGGKHCRHPLIPRNAINSDFKPDSERPGWPGWLNRYYFNGQPAASELLNGSPLIPMVFYADYVTAHSNVWNKPSNTPGMTQLEKALFFIREAEKTVDDSIQQYVDPETARITMPWNRYAAFIDVCITLEEIYDRMQDTHRELDNPERAALYHKIAAAYVDFILDPAAGYKRSYLRKNGKLVPVLDFPYACTDVGWGSASEMTGYSFLDFTPFATAYYSGRYPDVMTDARAFELAYNFRYRMYLGRNAEGKKLVAGNLNGRGGIKPGHLSYPMLWTAAFLPELYDIFAEDATAAECGLHGGGEWTMLRQKLLEQGLDEPGKRSAPTVEIVADRKSGVAIGEPVTLTAAGSGHVSYAWDVNRDGTTDYTTREITHCFTEQDLHAVTVRAYDENGHWGAAMETVVVNGMKAGTGTGSLHVSAWTEGLDGTDLGKFQALEKVPAQPDLEMEATALDTDGFAELTQGNHADVGLLFEGYLHPSVSGDYVFYVSTHNQAELSLSTDESPENMRSICGVYSWNPQGYYFYQWRQSSKPVYLEAGEKYYLKAVARINMQSPDQHLSYAWKLKDSPALPVPIEGEYLSPCQ